MVRLLYCPARTVACLFLLVFGMREACVEGADTITAWGFVDCDAALYAAVVGIWRHCSHDLGGLWAGKEGGSKHVTTNRLEERGSSRLVGCRLLVILPCSEPGVSTLVVGGEVLVGERRRSQNM